MWMQALLVRERILGLEHPHTCSNINNRGSPYARMGKYALEIQQKFLVPLDPITQRLLSRFIRLFCKMMTDEQLLEHFSHF